MRKNRLITPEGTKDYLYEEAIIRKNIEQKLTTLFDNHGFYEVVTPGLEFLDVFNVKGHSIPIEYMYKLVDAKGRLMVMRPDSTMPIARLIATRLKGQQTPIRLYYNQAVYSTTRSMSGQSDEIMQMGIELVGKTSLKADLEVITTAIQALQKCHQKNFRLEVGHIGIFNTLVNALTNDEDIKEQIRLLIEMKNYPALNDLLDKQGNSDAALVIKQLPRLFGGKDVFQKATAIINDPETIAILQYLKQIYETLQKLGLSDCIAVDLGIVNRTDYYTGVVFKGYIEGWGEEVLSGGRYDSLLSQFGEDMGAIGFAINVDAVTKALLIKNKPSIASADIMIFAKDGFEIEGIAYLQKVSEDNRCEFSLFDTLEETTEYARAKEISEIHIVSETIEINKLR